MTTRRCCSTVREATANTIAAPNSLTIDVAAHRSAPPHRARDIRIARADSGARSCRHPTPPRWRSRRARWSRSPLSIVVGLPGAIPAQVAQRLGAQRSIWLRSIHSTPHLQTTIYAQSDRIQADGPDGTRTQLGGLVIASLPPVQSSTRRGCTVSPESTATNRSITAWLPRFRYDHSASSL